MHVYPPEYDELHPCPYCGTGCDEDCPIGRDDCDVYVESELPELFKDALMGLQTLLSEIHNDGGEYTARVGLRQSIEDAIKRVIEWKRQMDQERISGQAVNCLFLDNEGNCTHVDVTSMEDHDRRCLLPIYPHMNCLYRIENPPHDKSKTRER